MASSSQVVQQLPTISTEGGNEPEKSPQEFPLARQSSIYSLTLDEFQHAICEPGKNFGSMNMDEFLTNIWNAEESQAVAAAMQEAAESEGAHLTQPSLTRQASLSVPAPLCRKTVEEVWSEIHRGQQQQPNGGNTGNAPRQPTLGEMTLEDFLIKAGVVRESGGAPASTSSHIQTQQPHLQIGYFRNNNVVEQEVGFGNVMTGGFPYPDPQNTTNGGMVGGIPAFQGYSSQQQAGGAIPREFDNFGGREGRDGGRFIGRGYGGRIGNGGVVGGFDEAQQPVSPVSSDGVAPSQAVDNSVGPFGLEIGGGGGVVRGAMGRRRAVGGPTEKGVERRQRRMIKNRESAARSRARKQV
ncbi:Basic-leucine zipper domain-containing protein [Cinnamomum micranthum f. kanehirae]|uniref:Basic-leucine zipper domain-containing protein n=1 Tax=Cinnamomum micranthum f. kanehirae TaxID=337451 RepID=A0A3S3N9Y3_9MAGN|nr:Basic-leucine zipper domain-containing protein [Cinnamomum micranthum f. kanehirae]